MRARKTKARREQRARETPQRNLTPEEVEELAEIIVRSDDPEIRTAAFTLLMDEIDNREDDSCDVTWHASRAAFASGDFAEGARVNMVDRMRSLRHRAAGGLSTAGDAVYAYACSARCK